MKNKLLFPVFLALISILISCEKVEDKVYMGDVAPPGLLNSPDLNLKKTNADDTIIFIGSPIDPGFQASIKYAIQVRTAGDESAKLSSIYSSTQDSIMKISVDDLNNYLLSMAMPWTPTTLDFIIKAELNSSAGRGAEEFIFSSAPISFMVTTYGDPVLNLINSGTEQSLETYEDGEYSDLVILLKTDPFTLYNPETKISYGGSDGILIIDGPAIEPPSDGEFMLIVSIENMTYNLIRVSAAVMNVIDSGLDQSLTSALGDGIYIGLVGLNPDMLFTLLEIDTEISYGGSDGVLIVDGNGISPPSGGWYMATINTNDMTYVLDPYVIGIVGAFTEWGELPDTPMDYDPEKGAWLADVELPVGPMKFRLNSDWAVNWGPGVAPDTDVDLPADGRMDLLNEWGNINIIEKGTYSIELTITGTSGSVQFTLN